MGRFKGITAPVRGFKKTVYTDGQSRAIFATRAKSYKAHAEASPLNSPRVAVVAPYGRRIMVPTMTVIHNRLHKSTLVYHYGIFTIIRGEVVSRFSGLPIPPQGSLYDDFGQERMEDEVRVSFCDAVNRHLFIIGI